MSNYTSSTVELVQLYYTPVLILSGFLGNCLAVVVFFWTKLRKYSSSYYLATLAVSDNVFLAALFIVWLNMVNVNWFNRHGMCQITVYATGMCSFLSVWLVTAFTFERFIAVKYPFLRQSLCTIKRAKHGIITLVVIAFITFSPLLIFSTVICEDDTCLCSIDLAWKHFANVFNYVDFLITYVIPVTITMYLNFSISRTILTLAGVRKILTQGMKIKEKRKRPRSFRISQNNITKMLLVVSTVFLCLNFPSYIMRLLAYLIEVNYFSFLMLLNLYIPFQFDYSQS